MPGRDLAIFSACPAENDATEAPTIATADRIAKTCFMASKASIGRQQQTIHSSKYNPLYNLLINVSPSGSGWGAALSNHVMIAIADDFGVKFPSVGRPYSAHAPVAFDLIQMSPHMALPGHSFR